MHLRQGGKRGKDGNVNLGTYLLREFRQTNKKLAATLKQRHVVSIIPNVARVRAHTHFRLFWCLESNRAFFKTNIPSEQICTTKLTILKLEIQLN